MASADNFRINLAQAIDAQKLTQAKVAELAGMKHPYVNRVLRGSTCPRGPQYDRLSAAVGFETWQLMMNPKIFLETVLTALSE